VSHVADASVANANSPTWLWCVRSTNQAKAGALRRGERSGLVGKWLIHSNGHSRPKRAAMGFLFGPVRQGVFRWVRHTTNQHGITRHIPPLQCITSYGIVTPRRVTANYTNDHLFATLDHAPCHWHPAQSSPAHSSPVQISPLNPSCQVQPSQSSPIQPTHISQLNPVWSSSAVQSSPVQSSSFHLRLAQSSSVELSLCKSELF
jgi:hypothetical protein